MLIAFITVCHSVLFKTIAYYDNLKICFKMGHLNVSLCTNINEFKLLIEGKNFDVLLMSETWLKLEDSTDLFTIPNYQIVRKDRAGRGGVGI